MYEFQHDFNYSSCIYLQLTSHRRQSCPEKQFPCKDCSETFRSAGLLRTHRLTQHPRPEVETAEPQEDPEKTPHHCKKCGQGFESEEGLAAHQEKYPEGQQCNGSAPPVVKKRGRPSKTEEVAASEKKAKRKKKDEAEAPEEEVKASDAPEAVVAAEAPPPAEEKPKPSGAKRGRPPKAAVKAEPESKKSSEEEAEAVGKEKKAKVDPAASRQHPCPECDQSFTSLIQLRTHKKEKHTPRKAHPCDECEESFARPEQLDAHTSRAHASGRFACSTCGKSFGRERTLKAHEKTHPEEKAERKNAKR